MGTEFTKYAWWAAIIGDYMKDVETSLRTCAADPAEAMRIYDQIWQKMIGVAEQRYYESPSGA
ncbi:MAG: hypothetical protein M0C28_10560 [Candidatus Moduliflexus flocculans]|nr:hypothetical protein [Candidatus Moduliflexus flocculans]